MATEVVTDARTSINVGSVVTNADCTLTIVVAAEQLEHPNALSTAGQLQGSLAFRWFLSDTVPDRPTIEVVDKAAARPHRRDAVYPADGDGARLQPQRRC